MSDEQRAFHKSFRLSVAGVPIQCRWARFVQVHAAVAVLAALVALAPIRLRAQRTNNDPANPRTTTVPAGRSTAPPANPAVYMFRGTVARVDAGTNTVLVSNENIPGWMSPMTMRYHVSNGDILRTLKVGDRVRAQVRGGDFNMLYDVRILKTTAVPALDLPPRSYVCPTVGEEGVIEERPGRCPKSAQALVPIRLTIAYSCLRGPKFIQAKPGVCAYDKSALVPVTASEFWLCESDTNSRRYLEPGLCQNGSIRAQHFEIRPHGDHNPRHGGLAIFMSSDLLHHIEGTFTKPDIFRVYFYDEYTRPMNVMGFSARVAIADDNAQETGERIGLVASDRRNGNSMEARLLGVPTPTKAAPLNVKLHVRFSDNGADWVTDYHFETYSREPPPIRAPQVGSGSLVAISATAPDGSAAPAAINTIPQSGGDVLPTTTRDLVALLSQRTASINTLLQQGNFAALWFPAIGAKDVALALQAHHASELSPPDRARIASATRQLTLVAWQIDTAGDLGNKERLLQLWQHFSAAASELQALYAVSH